MNPSAAKTILSVEDNAVNAFLVEAIFAEQAGVRLVTARNGEMGLELAQSQRPDLILLDLNLPDMDGEEFLAKLRALEATAAIPVIIVSADALEDQRSRMLHLRVADYVTKPFDVGHFERVVERHLKR